MMEKFYISQLTRLNNVFFATMDCLNLLENITTLPLTGLRTGIVIIKKIARTAERLLCRSIRRNSVPADKQIPLTTPPP